MTARYHYLSPIIFPLLPNSVGKTVLGFCVTSALEDIAGDNDDVDISIEVKAFANGSLLDCQTGGVHVAGGQKDVDFLEWCFLSEHLGYLEVSITANRPYFRKLLTENLFALVERGDGGTFNVHSQFKFSDPVVIDMMRRIGEFCLVHPAQHVSKKNNAGNSVLIINPFEGAVQARITSATGKSVAKRIKPREAVMVSLSDLIEDGSWECVLYTGNNRYPAWDVRHAYADQFSINRLDHMEYYRGNSTVRSISFGKYLRSRVRRIMRVLRLRNN